MESTTDVDDAKESLLKLSDKYRNRTDSMSITMIWFDIVYLGCKDDRFTDVLRLEALNSNKLKQGLRNVSGDDTSLNAVVDDFEKCVHNILLPGVNDRDDFVILNGIREDGITILKMKCSPVKILQMLMVKINDLRTRLRSDVISSSQINDLMASIAAVRLSTKETVVVYDPAVGFGGSLIAMRNKIASSQQVNLQGQEISEDVEFRTQMILDIFDDETTTHEIQNGDSLGKDWPEANSSVDVVISNPPYSSTWNPSEKLLENSRFNVAGTLPPKSKADLAFVLHGFSHLNAEGVMVVQLPQGILFRGAAEGNIRQYLVDNNYIDAVIGLPRNQQSSIPIPTVILVLRKKRNRQKILFVDVNESFFGGKTSGQQSTLEIEKIVQTYQNFSDIKRYSHVASYQEIVENQYNLNIPRYVDTFIPPALVSLSEIKDQLGEVDGKIRSLDLERQRIMKKYVRVN